MTGLIILAAGASSRLGQPKQNIVFNGKTLLENAIEAGLAAKCSPVLIMLGANAKLIAEWPHHPDVKAVYNDQWESGMASSIVAGVEALQQNYPADNAVIMVCDQPFVTPGLILDLISKQKETGRSIIASRYGNVTGVPALFDKAMFYTLLQLQGDEGARKMINDHSDKVASIPFEKGTVDIDTIDDYNKLTG